MKQSGRMLLPLIVLIAFVVASVAFFVVSSSSPESVAKDFMSALSEGNAKKLAQLSYLEGASQEQTEKIWRQTLDRGEYYRFAWRVKNSSEPTPDTATVNFDMFRSADNPGTYAENYALELVKVQGQWKVDVRQIPRGLYPALPR